MGYTALSLTLTERATEKNRQLVARNKHVYLHGALIVFLAYAITHANKPIHHYRARKSFNVISNGSPNSGDISQIKPLTLSVRI